MLTLSLTRCVEGEGDLRLGLFTCKTIKVMCQKIEETGAGVRGVLKALMG